MTSAVYLFCLTPADRLPEAFTSTQADADGPLRIQRINGIAAVYRLTPLADFHGSEAEARLQDWNWLEPRLHDHEAVIEQISRGGPVLPTRFGTLFSSLDALTELVTAHYATITAFLAQVEDCDEWAIKGLLDRKAAMDALAQAALAAQAAELAALAPGVRYLREQRIRQAAARELTAWLRIQQKQLLDELGVYSRACRVRPILPSLAPDESREPVWNWALLIPRTAKDAFQHQLAQAAQTLAPRGLMLSRSGPWPPYSFCPPLTGKAES
jgi:hypothetical protein